MPRKRTVLTPPPPPRATTKPAERANARPWSPAAGRAYRIRITDTWPHGTTYSDDVAELEAIASTVAWEGGTSIIEQSIPGGWAPYNPKPVVTARALQHEGLARERVDVTITSDGGERSTGYMVISAEGYDRIREQWR